MRRNLRYREYHGRGEVFPVRGRAGRWEGGRDGEEEKREIKENPFRILKEASLLFAKWNYCCQTRSFRALLPPAATPPGNLQKCFSLLSPEQTQQWRKQRPLSPLLFYSRLSSTTPRHPAARRPGLQPFPILWSIIIAYFSLSPRVLNYFTEFIIFEARWIFLPVLRRVPLLFIRFGRSSGRRGGGKNARSKIH